MDDREGVGVGVVDRGLFRRQRMLDEFVGYPIVGERAGGVETEGPQVARQHLHRRDTAGLDCLDELRTRGEGEVGPAP